jgi:hypothetical protein
MKALSAHAPSEVEQTTGMGCPDCPGVLGVSAMKEHLRFRCRIGHTYSLAELIASKEGRIEDLLWAPVTALTELAALLREAAAAGHVVGLPASWEERAADRFRQEDRRARPLGRREAHRGHAERPRSEEGDDARAEHEASEEDAARLVSHHRARRASMLCRLPIARVPILTGWQRLIERSLDA